MIEKRTPLTDEDGEARELTERDFAFARRRDGSLAYPKLYARYRLMDVEAEIMQVQTDDRDRVEAIIAAIRDVEKALDAEAPPVAAE